MSDAEKKPTLLIIDDDKPIRRLLARVAERSGFEVDTAKDGFEAVEMIGKKPYDIAIVDLMMPRLSGYELLQKISVFDPRPVVLVATALMNSDVAHLDDSMVRRVIRKPFDIHAVATALVETAREIAESRAAGTLTETMKILAPQAAAEPVAGPAGEAPAKPETKSKPLPPGGKIE
ncbi:MAG TPA: response regulator [Thermoanaerobaculia bacterium]|nr:response regulator [Thermoanaerobaculia bacterium]